MSRAGIADNHASFLFFFLFSFSLFFFGFCKKNWLKNTSSFYDYTTRKNSFSTVLHLRVSEILLVSIMDRTPLLMKGHQESCYDPSSISFVRLSRLVMMN